MPRPAILPGRRPLVVALSAAALLFSVGCATKRVSRIDPESVTDLSGRWNDTDSRLVARALIHQSLESAWADRYLHAHGGEPPTVIVGRIQNRSLEHIPVETFVNDLERALVNSGRFRVVARPDEREEVRAERADQQRHARAGTRARPTQETGAGFLLQGELQSIEDQEDRERIVYYQVDAVLVDLETNLKVWSGQHRIKKYIERRRVVFD